MEQRKSYLAFSTQNVEKSNWQIRDTWTAVKSSKGHAFTNHQNVKKNDQGNFGGTLLQKLNLIDFWHVIFYILQTTTSVEKTYNFPMGAKFGR